MRRKREADKKRQDLLAAVKRGEEQIAQGNYKRYTPELFDTIKRNSIEKAPLARDGIMQATQRGR